MVVTDRISINTKGLSDSNTKGGNRDIIIQVMGD
jgi:hypothetical protein